MIRTLIFATILLALSGSTMLTKASDLPPSPLTLKTKVSQPSCFGNHDGVIELLIQGGTPPYSVAWNNGSTDANLYGLLQGTYTCTVKDKALNQQKITVTLTAPAPIHVLVDIGDESCQGAEDGYLDVIVSGGVPPYDFAWSDGAKTEDRWHLQPGTWSLKVEDRNGCAESAQSVIFPGKPAPVNYSWQDTGLTVHFSPDLYTHKDYKWDFGDGNTGKGASPVHTYTASGTYSACLEIETAQGCTGTICHNISVSQNANGNLVATNSPQQQQAATQYLNVKVWPNPVSERFSLNFETDKSEPYELTITDLTGRVVHSESGQSKAGNNALKLTITRPQSSILFLNLNTSSSSTNARLSVKQ